MAKEYESGGFAAEGGEWESFGFYSREARKYRRLTPAEEKALQTAVSEKIPGARDRLVESCLALPIAMALAWKRKHPRVPISAAELVAAGNVGLVKASRVFDPLRMTRFATVAYYWIKQQLGEAAALAYPMRLPKALRRRLGLLAPDEYDPSLAWTSDRALAEKPFATAADEADGDGFREQAVRKALARLPAAECDLLLAFYGAFGTPRQTAAQLGRARGLKAQAVYRRVRKTERRLYALLTGAKAG